MNDLTNTVPEVSGRSILYYVERYLPASQAFIPQQARALLRYTPAFLAGSRIDSPSARIADLPVANIAASMPLRFGELALKIARVPLPPLFPQVRQAAILHAHFGKNGYVLAPLAKAASKPLVTTFHGFDATYAGDPNKPGGFNQVRYFRHGRAAMAKSRQWNVAVSDFVAGKLRSLGFSDDRILRHYIGINPDTFFITPVERKPNRVVSVARFVEYKGHRYMIEALSEVVKSGIPVEFVMVGQGPLRDEVESYARRLLPQVTIFDTMSQPEIAGLMASAQVYLHGSVTLENGHAEAFGLAILEAQAVGTPVVAFDSGGVAEAMLSGKTGYAVPEKDIRGMAQFIGKLLCDKAHSAQFSTAAAAMVREHFDIRRQTGLLENFYDEVLAQHRHSK